MEIKVKHVNVIRSKGRTYYYHRITGARLNPRGDETAEQIALNALNQSTTTGRNDWSPDMLGDLIVRFQDSPEFKELAEKTRKDYRRYMDWLRLNFGDVLIEQIDRAFVLEIRDSFQDTPRTANYYVSVLSRLFSFAIDRGLANTNPASAIKKLRTGPGHQPWPDNLIQKALERAYPELGRAIRLALYTGQRESDCVTVSWSHYDGEGIEVVQQKTGARLWVAAHRDLRAMLDDMPRTSLVVLTTKTGRPWKADHLRHEITKLVRDCGFEGYSFHGLRKNATKRLAEAGCSEHEIMAITGHTTSQMVQEYSKSARQKQLSTAAVHRLEQNES